MSDLSHEARGLLDASLSGYLGMADEDGPYVVPISFALLGDKLFIHGGRGRKAAALERDPRVCLSVVSPPVLVKGQDPCGDNFDYHSILLFGRAQLLTEPNEREEGLRALARKYHPEAAEAAFKEATLARTQVYAIVIENATWKEHPRRG